MPHPLLENDFPEDFITKYSHWFVLNSPESCQKYQIKKNHLHFREKKYSKNKFKIEAFRCDDYVMDFKNRIVFEQSSNNVLIDKHSMAFSIIHDKIFRRVSCAGHLHVWVVNETKDDIIKDKVFKIKKIFVQLPHMENLRFDYHFKRSTFLSREFVGMKIAQNQNSFGTFTGLNHGLWLVKDYDDFDFSKSSPEPCFNSLLLCPHGKLSRDKKTGRVSVDLKNLRFPSFFKYERREELKDVRSTSKARLSWVYLAQLHAFTSGLLPDPFTKCLGIVQAFAILRSGHCCGNLVNVIDSSVIRNLRLEVQELVEISRLSPWREDYHSMEKNNIPVVLTHALLSHPAYAFFCETRIQAIVQSLKAIGHENINVNHDTEESRLNQLSTRAYFQHRELYSKDSLLTLEEESDFMITNFKSVTTSHYILPVGFEAPVLQVMQEISHHSKDNRGKFTSPDLQSLLLCCETLKGLNVHKKLSGLSGSCFISICQKEGSFLKMNPSFENLWLDLYDFAKNCTKSKSEKLMFSQLLVWIASENPKNFHVNYLHQLVIVSTYPEKFPPPVAYGEYSETRQSEFDSKMIRDVLSQQLRKFNEREPSTYAKNYQHEFRLWNNRKESYNQKYRDTYARLQQKIQSDFQMQSVSQHRSDVVCLSDVRDPSLISNATTLSNNINELLNRWHKNKKMKAFINLVSHELNKIAGSKFSHISPLVKLERFMPSRKQHVTETNIDINSNNNDTVIETELSSLSLTCADELNDINQSYKLLKIPAEDKKKWKDLPLDDSFVQASPEYSILWLKMKQKLLRSWEMAQKEDDVNFYDSDEVKNNIFCELICYHEHSNNMMKIIWNQIYSLLTDNSHNHGLLSAKKVVGLWDCISPRTVIFQHFHNEKKNKNDLACMLVNKFALAIKHFQKARRCLRMFHQRKFSLNNLYLELSISGNWNPTEYPEFLAFEIDNDLCIRDVQAQVAFEILRTDKNNRLLQLNMGGGNYHKY